MFFRGQKVVCVDDEMRVAAKYAGWRGWFRKRELLAHNLNKGDVYAVTVVADLQDVVTGKVHQALFVSGAWHFGHREIPFPSFQFRPLVERKTDISVFKALLTPKKETTPCL